MRGRSAGSRLGLGVLLCFALILGPAVAQARDLTAALSEAESRTEAAARVVSSQRSPSGRASATTPHDTSPARLPIYRYGSLTENPVLRGPVESGLYTGTVVVIGVDHYGLDRDTDGIGCEP